MAYACIVFMFAFAIGALRVLVIAPRVGALVAVILEGPVVLAFSWMVSRWCCRRFRPGRDDRSRLLMGLVAFALLMLTEFGTSILAFGESVDRYMARNASAPGLVGFAMQVGFAVIPWIQHRLADVQRE
jgi:hypothetical protein